MKIRLLIIFTATLAIVSFAQKPQTNRVPKQPTTSKGMLSPRQIADKVLRSVVVVISEDKDGNRISQGSGFFFGGQKVKGQNFDIFAEMNARGAGDEKKLDRIRRSRISVVTNLHVLKHAWRVKVKDLKTGRVYDVRSIIGFDLKHDLCVLRLEDDEAGIPLTIDSSSGLSVGDDVFAAGNPKGLEGSFSKGIVSAIRQDRQLIQIDAAISPSSSGGPVVNSRGNVVGIAVGAVIGGENLNFAIPVRYLSTLLMKWDWEVRDAGAFAVTSKDNSKLTGSVRKVVTSEADVQYDRQQSRYVEKSSEIKEIKIFNFAGDVVETNLFGKGKLQLKFVYDYGEFGWISRFVTTYGDGRSETKTRSEKESIEGQVRGNVFSDTIEFSEEESGNWWVTFDANGNQVKQE